MIQYYCLNCGQKINATDDSVGKQAKCPKCSAVMSVPAPEPQSPETQIKFFCVQCGQKIHIPQQYQGRTCKCPQCNAENTVPLQKTQSKQDVVNKNTHSVISNRSETLHLKEESGIAQLSIKDDAYNNQKGDTHSKNLDIENHIENKEVLPSAGKKDCTDIPCPHCGKVYQLANKNLGKVMTCIECRKNFLTPSSAEKSTGDEKIVHFACLMCKTKLKAPESMEGKTVLCPNCECYAEVPAPEREPSSSEEAMPFKLLKLTKECPFCGEEIPERAKKCKHCGEFITELMESSVLMYRTAAPTGFRTNRRSRSNQLGEQSEYAGFRLRVLATLIDTIPPFPI